MASPFVWLSLLAIRSTFLIIILSEASLFVRYEKLPHVSKVCRSIRAFLLARYHFSRTNSLRLYIDWQFSINLKSLFEQAKLYCRWHMKYCQIFQTFNVRSVRRRQDCIMWRARRFRRRRSRIFTCQWRQRVGSWLVFSLPTSFTIALRRSFTVYRLDIWIMYVDFIACFVYKAL